MVKGKGSTFNPLLLRYYLLYITMNVQIIATEIFNKLKVSFKAMLNKGKIYHK